LDALFYQPDDIIPIDSSDHSDEEDRQSIPDRSQHSHREVKHYAYPQAGLKTVGHFKATGLMNV
jgi:hypothetical protein